MLRLRYKKPGDKCGKCAYFGDPCSKDTTNTEDEPCECYEDKEDICEYESICDNDPTRPQYCPLMEDGYCNFRKTFIRRLKNE